MRTEASGCRKCMDDELRSEMRKSVCKTTSVLFVFLSTCTSTFPMPLKDIQIFELMILVVN